METSGVGEDPDALLWNRGDPNFLYKLRENIDYHVLERIQRQLLDLVTQYSQRDLSLESDALNAVAGIAHHFQAQDLPICSIAGLPYIPWTGLQGQEKLLVLVLSFDVNVSRGIAERNPAFPGLGRDGRARHGGTSQGMMTTEVSSRPRSEA